jgi:maltose O-acetyltransferase
MRVVYNMAQSIYHRCRKIKVDFHMKRLISRGLIIGEECYFADLESVFFDPSHCYLISIGSRCIIAPKVRLIAHDASTKLFLNCTKLGRIEIKNNSFIGDSAIILPGVTIGPFSVIASGSIVTKNVPPYTIAAGNPAKIIQSLDSYLEKIESIKKEKSVFDESYFIEKLTVEKRRELLDAAASGLAFIV